MEYDQKDNSKKIRLAAIVILACLFAAACFFFIFYAPETTESGTDISDAQETVSDAQDHQAADLSGRVDFPDSPGADGETHHTVSFNTGVDNLYYLYSVPDGQTVETVPEPARNDYAFAGWYDAQTGEAFDASQPVTADISLNAQWVSSGPLEIFFKDYFVLILFACIAAVGIALLVLERIRRRRQMDL